MAHRVAIVMDCGSTTTRVVAVDQNGQLLAQASAPSGPVPQAGGEKGWLVWDLDALWNRLGKLSRAVCKQIQPRDIVAVTATTWAADGAPMAADGSLTYPPICWQCPRTVPTAQAITGRGRRPEGRGTGDEGKTDEKGPLASSLRPRPSGLAPRPSAEVSAWDLFRTTGYQVISFNTLLRLIWLRQHAPRALDEAKCWTMMAGLLSHRLCGEFSIDYTGASTMMAMDLGRRAWSPRLLGLAGVDESFFPRFVESGKTIGGVTPAASKATGIPAGTPVTAAGHDTQFAPIGSGAKKGEAILSSGTWEILMARVAAFKANKAGFDGGLIIEADALPGLFNPQLLMMGSGVLEWIAKHFYADVPKSAQLYPTMIGEAGEFDSGAGGVTVIPSFVAGTGPTRRYGTLGTLLGLTITTKRGQVYRGGVEGLSCQLALGIEMLEAATGLAPRGIRVVGGGSKNDLWNQIRADVTGLPVTTIEQKEATVLGAAICAFVGTGVYPSVESAQKAMKLTETTFRPSKAARAYKKVYGDYKALLPDLRRHYQPT